MGVTNIYFKKFSNDAITNLSSIVTHIATGDDSTTPSSSDTSLGNETFRESLFDTDIFPDSIDFQSFQDISENNSNFIREVGTFDASSGGTMYTRSLTNEINKTSSVEVFLSESVFISGVNV